jgi:hypothetical protein
MKAAIYPIGAALIVSGALLFWWPARREGASAPPLRAEPLPKIAVPKVDAASITRIEIVMPEDDRSRLRTVTIEKAGSAWELTAPIRARAAASKVEALISNLERLQLWKVVDTAAGFYDHYDLTEAKAVHVSVWRETQRISDFYCGKSSADGQLVRVPDRDGIFALVNWGTWGYAGFLYIRDPRSWRETSILSFDPDDVAELVITNAHGVLRFRKERGAWSATVAGRRWPAFDPEKLQDFFRVYRSLSADDFGADADEPGSGLADAASVGGVVRISLQGGRGLTLRVGGRTTSRTRWAPPKSRWAMVDGDRALYVLSPWTADWATATPGQFTRKAPR